MSLRLGLSCLVSLSALAEPPPTHAAAVELVPSGYRLVLVELASSTTTHLASGRARNLHWNDQGSALAYVVDLEVWLYRLGKTPRLVLPGPAELLRFSPDGDGLAALNQTTLALISNLSGTKPRVRTLSLPEQARSAVWISAKTLIVQAGTALLEVDATTMTVTPWTTPAEGGVLGLRGAELIVATRDDTSVVFDRVTSKGVRGRWTATGPCGEPTTYLPEPDRFVVSGCVEDPPDPLIIHLVPPQSTTRPIADWPSAIAKRSSTLKWTPRGGWAVITTRSADLDRGGDLVLIETATGKTHLTVKASKTGFVEAAAQPASPETH